MGSRDPIDPFTLGNFTAQGRMLGAWIYILLCRDDGLVYVKIGITEHPDARLASLRNSCAVTPRSFSTIEVYSRELARRIEVALHAEFAKERRGGEWFAFDISRGSEFRGRWRGVLQRFDTDPSRPMKWSTVAVRPLSALARRRYLQWIKRNHRRVMSLSFKDFRRGVASDDGK